MFHLEGLVTRGHSLGIPRFPTHVEFVARSEKKAALFSTASPNNALQREDKRGEIPGNK
jgi:hypothetical protein